MAEEAQDLITELNSLLQNPPPLSVKDGAKRWLGAYQRLEQTLDPAFDPKDMPQLNVEPPAGVPIRPGTAPESIQDPQIRAAYEAAVAANAQKARHYQSQSRLRELANRFWPRAEEYVIQFYSQSWTNRAEMDQLLAQYIKDRATIQRIMQKVQRG